MAKVIGKREMVVDCINSNCRSIVSFDWSEVKRKKVHTERKENTLNVLNAAVTFRLKQNGTEKLIVDMRL